MVGDGDNKAEGRTSKQTPDEEQPLDEAAMRAAEIHEVLTGLRDFKNRIIEGKRNHFTEQYDEHHSNVANWNYW